MPTKQPTIQVARVAPGRSVHVGERCFGPGEEVRLAPEDAARLAALGFVQVASEEETAVSTEPPAGATVQVQDGAQVIQG